MKTTVRLTFILTALALSFAACEKNSPTIANDGNGNGGGVVDIQKERVIIYAVGNNENRRTLETDGEWDALLEQLCDQALGGSEVTFYNLSQTTYLNGNTKDTPAANRRISTSSRNEIKAWMKEMEKSGLTVRVTYDDGTGTWHGEAYTTVPAVSTSGNIIGTWHLSCMVVTHVDPDGNLMGSDLFVPEEGDGTMLFTFATDGTITMTMHGIDGTTVTDNSTWTLSDDGVLCSELLPSGECWNVNWTTSNTMIISHEELGTEEGDLHYQLQFDAATE